MRRRYAVTAGVGIGLLVVGGLAQLTSASGASTAAVRTSFTTGGRLADVAVISARNAWAVGGTNGGRTLIVHWNGASWQQMAGPRGSLSGIAAVSAGNVWAVGQSASQRALILHWNGTSWEPSPGVPAGGGLTSVAALNAHSAWAVGSTGILRWDGHIWKRVSGPVGMLTDVVSISPRDAWVVGSSFNRRLNESEPLISHWTGSTWKRVAAPGPRGNGSVLHSVAAVTGHPTWTVGCDGCAIGGVSASLVAQWTGHSWARRPAPPAGRRDPARGGQPVRAPSLGSRRPIFDARRQLLPEDPHRALVRRSLGTGAVRKSRR